MKSGINKILMVSLLAASVVIIYLARQKTPSAAEPVAAATPKPAPEPPPESPHLAAPQMPVVVATTNPPVLPANSYPQMAQASAATDFSKTIDALLDPHINPLQKHALFQQLAKEGELDHVIAELKQRAADNPGDPEIPTTLGEAQLNKLRALRAAGGADPNDIAILAMQADQSFNAALKVDPANWEAQMVKATAMSHWPADATRDAEVVQRLSKLIDQQEATSAQPQFAQTYVVLGEQYMKIGKPDFALQTWKLGAQKFPNDPALQSKLASQ